ATRAGTGPPSTEVICTTTEDVGGIPAGIRVIQSGSSDAVVSWLPPFPATGVLQGYTLYHRSPGAHRPVQLSLHNQATSYTLTHLSQGSHQLWLTARTRLGEGKPTNTVTLNLRDQNVWGVSSIGRKLVSSAGQD
ncbi:unnamed protein product, partial [Meganyctiphanes norvegica]